MLVSNAYPYLQERFNEFYGPVPGLRRAGRLAIHPQPLEWRKAPGTMLQILLTGLYEARKASKSRRQKLVVIKVRL